jgi:uncharacterized protein
MEFTSQERQILDEVTDALHRHYGDRLSRVVLYGSRARRDHEPESDYDIIVALKDDAVDWSREHKAIFDAIYEVECRHWVVVSCQPVSEAVFEREMTPMMINARREGVQL